MLLIYTCFIYTFFNADTCFYADILSPRNNIMLQNFLISFLKLRRRVQSQIL